MELAVALARKRHPLLGVRLAFAENATPLFLKEDVGLSRITVISGSAVDQWKRQVISELQTPFALDSRPLIRFTLLQSERAADLLITCHHSICDGLSLAYLLQDLMNFLENPDQAVEPLKEHPRTHSTSIPGEVRLGSLERLFAFALSRRLRVWGGRCGVNDPASAWAGASAAESLKTDFWHLSREQTRSLLERCRAEGVTANTALNTAFVASSPPLDGRLKRMGYDDARVCVPVGCRDRYRIPPGRRFGLFAVARAFHGTIQRQTTDRKLFRKMLFLEETDPLFVDSLSARLRTGHFARARSGNPLIRLLRKNSLASSLRCLVVSNLGSIDYRPRYGDLVLENAFLVPANDGLSENVIGVVTARERMNFSMCYRYSKDRERRMSEARERAMEALGATGVTG
jgi:hypothetical protein